MSVFAADAVDELANVLRHRVVGSRKNAASAARGHHLRRLFDRFRTTGGSGTRTCASAAAVDDRAGFTETERNAATGATRGASDKCDATVE
jgi:hypothetical protein